MRRPMGSLLLATTILCAAGTVTACGSSVGSSISSAISSRTTGQTAISSPAQSTSSPPAQSTSSSPAQSTSSSAATSSTPSVPAVTSSPPSSSAAPAPVVPPSASATATANGTSSIPIWVWIVIGLAILAVIIGVIALITRSSRRRAAVAAGWRTKIIDVYAEGSALLDAMRIADARGLVTGDRAADAQWADIQRRVDDLARALYALREEAPDDESRARVADVLAALQAARSTMDSDRASGTASGAGEEMIRSRLAAFEASLRTLRSAYYPQA